MSEGDKDFFVGAATQVRIIVLGLVGPFHRAGSLGAVFLFEAHGKFSRAATK
jgi:hypothetical protein